MKMALKIILVSKRSKAMLVVFVILSIAAGFLTIFSNNMLRAIFDENLFAQGPGVFLPGFLFVFLFFLLIFAMRLLNNFMLQSVKWRGEAELKKHCLNKILRANYEHFVGQDAAGIWPVLNVSTQFVAGIFESFIKAIPAVVSLAAYGVVIFSVDFYAGILAIVAIPVNLALTRGVGRGLGDLNKQIMANMREMGVSAQEALRNMPNIKAKNTYSFFIDRFMKVQYNTAKVVIKYSNISEYLSGIIGIVSIIAPMLILFGAMQLSDTLYANTGAVLLLFLNVPLFLSSFGNVYTNFITYKSFRPGLKHLEEINDLPETPSGSIVIDSLQYLETKDVTVQFENRLVSVPDLRIEKGEKIMFMGESGIGKSTLFNIILGLIHNYSGSVIINGHNLRDLDIESVRKVFGIAFQKIDVLTLTLSENVLLGKHLSEDEVKEIIRISGLEAQLEAKQDQELNNNSMSGGEKSRLGLAQLLAMDNDVLLIDETFSNVDEDTEKTIMERLLVKCADKTIIYIGHRVQSQGFFDRVIVFGA